ncbi:EpsG family protein [Bacteroides pyogenes]|uniref:EpsG family protein n=1 Tax=Bacteroides pyogenes TaxID=310300 RepID=A0A5D3E9N7_9BACE|nr:EpsG family protein [Bacteroides pyogenes]MCI7070642.1 EpsG family protein [Bacteroides pyogenes]TYK32883.1 EpsG family protein [Bacteroides pyogenes]TYK50011.1 EpsG family protein [Bacteroides pyogenes]
MIEYLYYSFIYVLLFVAIFIVNKQFPNDKFCYVAGFILAMFAGLSYDVGWDYVVYRDMMLNKMDYSRIELLEQWLLIFCKDIKFPQLFFLVNHFVIVFCNVLVIKKVSPNKYISVILFLCLPLSFLTGISTIRAAVTASIMFYAYEYYLRENKVLYFLGCGIICFFVHASSLIFVLMIFVRYINIPLIFNILLFAIAFIFSKSVLIDFSYLANFSFMADIVERFDYYQSIGNDSSSSIPYIYYALNVLNFIFYKQLVKNDKITSQYITLFNIGCCLSLFFSFNHTMSLRFSRFYYSWLVLLIPYYSIVFYKQRFMITKLIIGLSLLLLLYQLYLPNYNGTDPFRISTYWPYQLFFLAD